MKDIKDLKLKTLENLKEMEQKPLRKEYEQAAKTLYVLRMKKELGEQKQTHLITVQRKYIARIKTVANSKWISID